MRFLLPSALWLLLLLPCLVCAYFVLQRRRKQALRYASLALIRDALTQGHRLRAHLPGLLFLAAIAVSVLAIARPAAVVSTPSHQRTIVLAMDVSLSMAAEDVAPNRLAAAQAAARTFIASQPRDVRIAVVAFAGHADLVQPPTADHAQAIQAIDHLQLQHHTAIGSGVIAALLTIFPDEGFASNWDIFGSGHVPAADPIPRKREGDAARPQVITPGSHPSAAIVLLTDGRDTFGLPASKVAKFAAERGVRVYTVGFGRPGTTLMDVDGEAADVSFDESALKTLAAGTRGEYFHASTAHELKNVYRNLSGRVVLTKTGTELSALAAAAAAILMLAAGMLSLARSNPLA